MFGNNQTIGIEIGTRTLKLVLIQTGKKPRLKDAQVVKLPDNAVLDGELLEFEKIASIVRSAVSGKGWKAKSSAVCINSTQAVIRELKLPALKTEEILPAIEFEISQSFPGVANTHYLSYKIYERTESEIRGIYTFCPKKVVDSYVRLSEAIGASVRYVDVMPNAIAKGVYNFVQPVDAKDAVLVCNIGYTNSYVSILNGHQIIISRNIQDGSRMLDTIFANRNSISEDEAEAARMIGFKGFELDQSEIESYYRIGYAGVEDQIRRTLEFYSYSKSPVAVSKILLSGGVRYLPGIEGYYSELFGIPTTVVKPKQSISGDALAFPIFLPAIGACIRED